MDILEAMKKEMFRRRLSPRTMATYLHYIREFLNFCKKEPKQFSKKDIRQFLEKYSEKDYSGSTLNVAHNSLRFMMEEILRKSMKLNLRYSKTPKSLPTCLSRDEIKRLIDSINNEKHNLLISLMYGAGLRLTETIKLKPEDLDLDSNIGWVRHGKGNKDRPFIIPKCLKNKLKQRLNNNYIFEGRQGHLSGKSVQLIIKKATKKAKINKNVHPHTLRHSFATHLIESNCDITAVQSLLGHSEARTTMVYLHTAKPKLITIKSPLDNIFD